jgi:ATP/maltotriose-dependent transcriptional regulator MalT
VTRVALSRLLATTEGWPVGLHLAVLTLRGQPDPEPILARIEGNAMWAGAALVAEVLSMLSGEYQDCLLRISVVDRFCAPLCEALCSDRDGARLPGQSGEEFLSWLERSDLFITALDDDHEWYRFHHLFRDLLRRRLEDRLTSDAIAQLRRTAGEWFEASGRGLVAVPRRRSCIGSRRHRPPAPPRHDEPRGVGPARRLDPPTAYGGRGVGRRAARTERLDLREPL